jgi:hypothetical protein
MKYQLVFESGVVVLRILQPIWVDRFRFSLVSRIHSAKLFTKVNTADLPTPNIRVS